MKHVSLAFCIPILFFITSLRLIAAETQIVKVQEGTKDVPKDGKIESEEIPVSIPQTIIIGGKAGNGKIKIISKTFIPPKDYKFKMYDESTSDKANPGAHIDIMEQPTAVFHMDQDTEDKVKVDGIFVQNTAMDYPFEIEGNLRHISKPVSGNGGTSTPPHYHWAARIVKLKVDHQTTESAPDGTPDDRTSIGVFERVKFYTVPQITVDWEATNSATGKISQTSNLLIWDAMSTRGTATITAKYMGEIVGSVEMTAIEPQSPSAVILSTNQFPPGTPGVGMLLQLTINPKNVCFGFISTFENEAPPDPLTGYFKANFDDLGHDITAGAAQWIGINSDNKSNDQCDTELPNAPRPFSAGIFDWKIKNQYRGKNYPNSVHEMYQSIQHFEINAQGTVRVSKFGVSVSRTIDGAIK